METKNKTKKLTLKKRIKNILNKHVGRDMFLVLDRPKINIWTVLFKRKQILNTIENNYILLENDKYMSLLEISEELKKK